MTLYHDIEQNVDVDCDPGCCRDVVRGLLKIEDEFAANVTYNLVGRLFEEQPDLPEWIRDKGQDIAWHSYNHQADWHPRYYADEVARCRGGVRGDPGATGHPRSGWDNSTLKALWSGEFSWNAEYDSSRAPYYIYKNLVRLPIAADDWQVHTGAQSLGEWIGQFRDLMLKGSYFGFGCHDCVIADDSDAYLDAWENHSSNCP